MGANTNPVQVRHNGNYPIQWFTDSIQRMQLWNTRTGTVNGFNGIRQNGFVGISNQPLFFSSAAGPFSRLHLADSSNSNSHLDWAQQQGFRPWMRNGITMTGNRDQCYVGQKYNGTGNHNDSTDLVLQWSDNADGQQWATDRLRFLFTSSYSGGQPYGARSREGLESFRVYIPNDTSAFVGIGDWWRATVQNGGSAVDPNERLDILDRTIRIRRLIPDYNSDTLSRAVVVDGNGRLHWRRIDTWPVGSGGSGCEWSMYPGSPNHVYTAVGGANASCPDDSENVGIGNSSPTAKLEIRRNPVANAGSETGIRVYTLGNDQGNPNMGIHSVLQRASGASAASEHTGVLSVAHDGVLKNYGMFGTAIMSNGQSTVNSTGVRGECVLQPGSTVSAAHGVYGYSTGKVTSASYGVYGFAHTTPNDTLPNTPRYVGVFGKVQHSNVANRWAAYFEGKGFLSLGPWVYSDASLKADIEPVENAMGLLQQLEPKSYRFQVEEHPNIGLPDGRHMGLLAQDVEELIPGVVEEVHRPADVDSSGVVTTEAMSFKAMNYTALIPLVIAAVKEQQTTIEAQGAQIAQLQQALAACCANPNAGDGRMHTGEEESATEGDARKLSIAPNPFHEQTTLYYTLEKAGRAQLLVNSSDGKQLRVLHEGTQQAGQFQHVWNTTGLAPGLYYVTLLLDGEPVVKKAVKVAH